MIFVWLILLVFAAWLIGKIRETHEIVSSIEIRLSNIVSLLEKINDNK